MKELLNIINLTTGYHLKKGNKIFLHSEISTTVSKGELIAILGPNGAGKSTLLKTLLGFTKKIKGEIFYNGKNLKNISIKELSKIISIVLTDKPDDIYLNAQEIISSGRYPYTSNLGKLNEQDIVAIKNASEITGVLRILKRKFITLSDGEKQRIMIARALAQDTPLILLDEPTAFIDSPGKVELMWILKNITKRGKTVITTIHDVELALQYADELWLLGKNGYFTKGKPEELISKGAINKIFDNEKVVFDKEKRKFTEKNIT